MDCKNQLNYEEKKISKVKFTMHNFSQVFFHLLFLSNFIAIKISILFGFFFFCFFPFFFFLNQERKQYTLPFKVRKHFISPRLLFPAGKNKNAACVNQTVSTSILSKYQCSLRHLLAKFAIIQIQNLFSERILETWSGVILFIYLTQEKWII